MEGPFIIKVFTRSSEVSEDKQEDPEVSDDVYEEHQISSEHISNEQADRDSKFEMQYHCLRNDENKEHHGSSVKQNMDSENIILSQTKCDSRGSKSPEGHSSKISTHSNVKNSLKRKRTFEANENEDYDEIALRSEMKKINLGTVAKFSQYYMNLDDKSKEIYLNKLTYAQCLDPYTLDSKGLRRRNTIIPKISKQEIVDFLSKSVSPYAHDFFENYQKTDAYQLVRSGLVMDVSAKKLHEGKCLIKAVVMVKDGMSTSYLPWLIVNEKGSPKFSHCNCSTGLVEVCCHITALMFSLEGEPQLEQHIPQDERETLDKEDTEVGEKDVETKPTIRRIIRRRRVHSSQGELKKRHGISVNGIDPWEKEFEDFHVVACTTLEEVQDIIQKHEEETWTKFVRDYKDPRFGSSDWTPDLSKCRVFWFKNVDKRLTAVPILSEGIPFVHVGRLILNCHQGRDAWKKKKEKHKRWKSSLTPNEQAVRKLKKNNIDSKKIGCPAGVYVTQVARFPDYSIQKLRKKKTRVIPAAKEGMDTLTYSKLIMGHRLKKAFMCNPGLLRMEIRYYIRLPKLSAHQGHPIPTQLPTQNNNEEPLALTEVEKCKEESPWPKDLVTRTREPVDPRVRDYIAQLTRQGVKSVKSVRELIIAFVRDVLFKEQEPPPINRRRYFPAEHDIRNAIYKTKLEMKKEAKQDLRRRCSALVQDISHLVASKDDESYLLQLEEQLKLMYNSIQSNMPIELVSFRPEDIQGTCGGEMLKKEKHRNEQEVERATYHLEQQMILQQDPCNSTQIVHQDPYTTTHVVKQDPTQVIHHEPDSSDEIVQQGSSGTTHIVHQEPSDTSPAVHQNTQIVQNESSSTQIVEQEESRQAQNNVPIVEGSATSVTEVYYYNPAGYYEQVVGSSGVVANQEYSISEVVYETQI